MVDEKTSYSIEDGSYDTGELRQRHGSVGYDRKASLVEGQEVFGDVQTVEEYGYVNRGMKSRHVQFIALGSAIGTGLFLGIGQALYDYGPLSILLAYTIVGFAIFGMMMSLGEMATWLPLPGAIPQYCTRFADPALGFAAGWNQWYSNALSQCSEISAAASLIGFWAPDINPAPWITIMIIVILSLNIFAVKIYGETEFWFAGIKILGITGLIIYAFIVDLGGNPLHDRLGFRYWVSPGYMPPTVASGDAGRFLSFFSTLVNAAFSYGGVESVAIAAGETEDPRRNIPKAVRRIFWRIIVFYSLGSLAIGVLVPYNTPILDTDGTRASPWVLSASLLKINALPSIINAVILISAASAGNAFQYSGSRYLYGLAQRGQAPKIFLKCHKGGVPYYCVLLTSAISCLTYMAVSSGSGQVFSWFLNLTTISNLFTWFSICIASIKFNAALKAQGVQHMKPFVSRGQPYVAWFSMCFFAVIIFFNGWQVFTKGNWAFDDFFTAYIGVPIYFALLFGWKIFKKSKWVKSSEADLWSGKEAIDRIEWPERKPRNILERIWFWIA
ncbi:MAG: hypothetical protein Q9159_004204 [Coniocarpon cinnabarinum]